MNEGFKQAYESHYNQIYNYVFFRLLNHHDTEDIVSEVFIKALSNFNQFEGRNGASISTWLFTIARNAVNDHFRQTKNQSQKPPPAPPPPYRDNITEWEERHHLQTLLTKLDDRSREALALRYWAGMSYAEISAKMGIKEKTISMILSRSLTKLRKSYADGEIEGA